MLCCSWRLRCIDCPHVWDTVLPEDTDPELIGEKCPECGAAEFEQTFLGRT